MLRCLLALACSLAAFTANSQSVKFGVKGGVNAATVHDFRDDVSRARLGINLGISSEVDLGAPLVVRPELLYSSKGFGFGATATSMSGSQRLNYLTLPLLVGYKPTPKLTLLAGPEFGYLIKAVTFSQSQKSDNTSLYRRFDIGADLGATYSVTKEFAIDARYNYGFKDLVNVAYVDNSGNVVSQGHAGANRMFQVGFILWLSE